MIPRTWPSEYVTPNGKTQMIVYALPSVVGFTRWIDYIPVKGLASENTSVENTYATNGYILMKSLPSNTNLVPFKDYIPVYEDLSATVPWSTDANGYIPAFGVFTVASLFANNEPGVWYDPSDVYLNWRRNLLTYTQEFDNAAWTKTRTTITANAIFAPDSTLTSDKLVETATTGLHLAYQDATVLASFPTTFSIFLKAGERSVAYLEVGVPSVSAYYATADLLNGTISSSGVLGAGAVFTSASITAIEGGWYRVVIVGVHGSATTARSHVYLNNGASNSYTGDGTSGIYIWGAQLEQGSTATAYQRIVTPEITYLADVQPQPILYQDSAGTVPVTAVEQPVGLMLDKSKGLVLGSELVTNGDFSNGTTGWSTQNSTISVVDGKLRMTVSTNGTAYVFQAFSTTPGKAYSFTGTLVFDGVTGNTFLGLAASQGNTNIFAGSIPGTYRSVFFATGTTSYVSVAVGTGAVAGEYLEVDNISVRELPGNHAYQSTSASRPTLSARINAYVGTETLSTQNVTTLAANYTLSFTGTGSITLSGTATGTYSAGTHTITCTAGTLTSTVTGTVTKADLRVTNDALNQPAYQRVNTSTDYDTVGFLPYLRFDGSDDWLVTNTITPGTDKVQTFAGVRKLSDATTGMIVEFSANVDVNSGVFQMTAPRNASVNEPNFYSKGTSLSGPLAAGNKLPSPITNILTGLGDISGDSAILRVNGTQAASSTADQGTGNYLAYPLYIGRRGGTTLPFNGRLYSLITRFGPTLTTSQITSAEKYVGTKTGITL